MEDTVAVINQVLEPITEAAAELRAWRDMIVERQPGLRDRIDEVMVQAAEEMRQMFQPLIDYADGNITKEEYLEVTSRRAAEEMERRRRHWEDDPAYDGEIVDLECVHCDQEFQWSVPDADWPPTYFECSDVSGTDCRFEDDDLTT